MKRIYAYTTDTYRRFRGWLKVGETIQESAEIRVKQQDGTSCPEPLEIERVWTVPLWMTDRMIHDYLRKAGFKQVRLDADREWFECTVDDVSAAINSILHGVARPNAYPMRQEQQECHDKAVAHFRNGGNKFLMNAKMRFGKTFTAYQIAKSLGIKTVLIMTYKPAVKDAWREDLENHVDFADWQFFSADQFSSSDPIMLYEDGYQALFTSFQDFNDFDKKKWKHAKDYHYDLVIVDEMHYGAKTERALKSLYQLSFDRILYSSGTPLKALMSGEFLEEETYTWSYADEQAKRKQEEDAEWQSEVYRWLPPMHFHTFEVCDEAKQVVKHYSDAEGFTMTKLFGVNDEGKFLDEPSVKTFLDQVFGRNVRKTHSPMKTMAADHSLWVLPACVKSVNALADMLQNLVGSEYHIINVAGDNIKCLDRVKRLIRHYDKTITISCGRFNTGVTVPEWDMIFMLDDGKAPETYFQTVFRCQSPDKHRGKDKCVVVDFNPQRLLELVYRFAEITATKVKGVEPNLREMLEFAPIFDHSGNAPVQVDVDKVFSFIAETGGYVDSFGSAYMLNWDQMEGFESYFDDVDAEKAAKIGRQISENGLLKGKNFKSFPKGKGPRQEDAEKALRERVITAMRNIPTYLFVESIPITCVQDIIDKCDPEVFESMIQIPIDGFASMCYDGAINTERLNRCIMSYNQLEQMV